MIRRLSSLMVALWFALYVGAPQLLHPCPQHAVQGVWGASTSMANDAASSASSAHHATSAAHSHGAPHSGDSSTPAGEHDCCCPGPQCGSSAVVVAVDTSWIRVSIVDASVTIAAPPLVPASSRVAYTLPYATAPPVTAPA